MGALDDLAVSWGRIGDMYLAVGDLILSHAALGLLPGSSSHLRDALKLAEAMAKQGLLAPEDTRVLDDLRRGVADVR
jgi:hypothetical protein